MIRHASVLAAWLCAATFNVAQTQNALAWGDEGHEVVALVAQSFLEPDVRKRVTALLASDTDTLTGHDIASAATWADKFRDANIGGSRQRTRQWHFIDIEITAPNFDEACFNHPPIPTGTPASDGPEADCVVDKIQEFAAELANPSTDIEEQVAALKFVLHFVGDVHQPLHSSDDHDRGGNDKRISASGFSAGNLHHFWDTEFVDQLGPDPKTIASDLIGHITKDQQLQCSQVIPLTGPRRRSGSPRATPTGNCPSQIRMATFGFRTITSPWQQTTWRCSLARQAFDWR